MAIAESVPVCWSKFAGLRNYTITPTILARIEEIGEAIGRAKGMGVVRDLRLRRINRIQTIRGSLAIEGNVLSEEQISTILDGKPVAGPLKDLQEARNAIAAYDRYATWNPGSERDLLTAHGVLMAGLLQSPGRYRLGPIVVMGEGQVEHIGPPARRVPGLMTNLMTWVGTTDEYPLITSSVFHYEFEFIHPFDDGNGRLGRLWQTLILTRWKHLFADVPVESLVHARQNEYYRAIQQSSEAGEGTSFVEFMLGVILEALLPVSSSHQVTDQVTDQATDQVTDQVARLLSALRESPKAASTVMAEIGLSHRPSFRSNYLRPAMSAGLVEMTRPDSPTAKNQQYRLTRLGRCVLLGITDSVW